jgi:hypothetical protein
VIASLLIAASAAILFVLAGLHLVFTFWGRRFYPRDAALEARMREVSPFITRKTTMWKTWIGFNASHSLGGLLYGTVYGYLALVAPAFLFASGFLLAVGLILLASYAILGKVYWFSTPYYGILASLACYVAALVVHAGG